MRIRVNGEAQEIEEPLSILGLLERLQIDARRVAVEHNLVIVKRDRYGATVIHDGDEIEIVNFVGGGSQERGAAPGRES